MLKITHFLAIVLLSMLFSMLCPMTANAQISVKKITSAFREKNKIDPFYEKYVEQQLPLIVGSKNVSDNSLAEAGWIVKQMLDGRADIANAMAENKVRVAIMAATESTTDIPEHSFLRPQMYWNRRARGLGATVEVPVVSASEENILGYIRDPYPNENIFVHEFAHAIHGTGLNKIDPTFDDRLKTSYEKAIRRSLWKNSYAATNKEEYWAEGVQCWFDDNAPADALHNHIRTRVQLKEYDAELAKLCKEVFGDKAWRYVRPHKRNNADRLHLSGYNPAKLPRFQWKEYPIGDQATVIFQTSAGDFEVEVNVKGNPDTCRNFLKITLDGAYHSGSFHQSITRKDGSATIYASVKKQWLDDYSKELKLINLPNSVKPVAIEEGMVAFVKKGSLGDLAIYTGKANIKEDVIILGKVSKGLEVVQQIQSGKVDTQNQLKEKIDIRRAIRSE